MNSGRDLPYIEQSDHFERLSKLQSFKVYELNIDGFDLVFRLSPGKSERMRIDITDNNICDVVEMLLSHCGIAFAKCDHIPFDGGFFLYVHQISTSTYKDIICPETRWNIRSSTNKWKFAEYAKSVNSASIDVSRDVENRIKHKLKNFDF